MTMIGTIVLSVLMLAQIIFLPACGQNEYEAKGSAKEPLPATGNNGTHLSSTTNGICSADFANSNYPSPFPEGAAQLSLSNGKEVSAFSSQKTPNDVIHLNGVYFGDITGDGQKDAIVIIDISTGGSAMPRAMYAFESSGTNDKKYLWHLMSGDRADGGFRSVYSSHGNLVVETYREEPDGSACCPREYEKTIYKWSEKRFDPISSEVLPNIEGNASFKLATSRCD